MSIGNRPAIAFRVISAEALIERIRHSPLHCSGGPLYYVGRDMKTSHRGMGISQSDWQRFIGHLETTLDTFEVPAAERAEVLGFINSTKADIVE